MKAKILVFLQFSSILLVIFTGSIWPLHILSLILAALGITLGLWAIAEQGIGNFNITPTNKSGSELISSGPYRLIRHPMYLAILLTLIPLVVEHYNLVRLIFYVLLLLTLIAKLEYEEKQLQIHFSNYDKYRKKTFKLFPFLY